MRTFLVLAAMLAALACHARLGETEAQLVERYGEPFRRGTSAFPAGSILLRFQKAEFSISATLTEGRCYAISFELQADRNLTVEERTKLRDVNHRSTWTMIEGNGQKRIYLSDDKRIYMEVEQRRVYLIEHAIRQAAFADAAIKQAESERRDAEAKAAAEAAKQKREAAGLAGF